MRTLGYKKIDNNSAEKFRDENDENDSEQKILKFEIETADDF